MTVIMIAIGFDIAAFMIGVALAKGLTLADAICSALLGSTLLGLLAISCSIVGSRTGLSTTRIAWFAFGHYGARPIALISGISLLGWFGVQAGFLGSNLADIFETFGMHIPAAVFSIGGGILMTSTAIYGYRSMERLSRWTVPALIFTMGMAITLLFLRNKGLAPQAVVHPIKFTAATGYVIGGFLSAVSCFPDISRYARSTRDAALGAFFGFFLGNSLMLVIAIVLAKYTGEADVVKLFSGLHMAAFAIVVLTLAQWAVNTSNIYSISLAFSNVVPEAGIPKAVYAIAAGIVGTALAAAGLADHFLNFLVMMSIVIAPIGGAYSGYYFLTLRGQLPKTAPAVVPITLLAWFVGILFGWLTMRSDPGNGLFGAGAFTLTTVSPVDGFLIAFLVSGLPSLGFRPKKILESA
ncbi:permease for cytosine/purine, uracil, thiamine, allantoin family protein [Collimonas pratensis]|uniref:Permease for cytosine/purine, uracil, thiamine, allantoin family protein n=2 Tax=Collimonas pratensis TaxID=279113 RepID=A0ABN4M5W9_9BURK|nr:permease for cytosine/purine, uracil, thiamine, allantoin family protein [Collimonas pratensis]